MDEETYLEQIALCAYKPEIEVNDAERKLRAIEKRRCRESFLYFLKYARIVEPPTLDNPGGIIPFQFWEHLKKMIAQLLVKKQIVLLKSRQIGASWLLSLYDLWYAMSHQGATVMIFSKGETEAIEKLAKCRRAYIQLPDFLKLKLGKNSDTEMGFPVMMSYIKAFAATETAGISFTASVLDIDEWAEHPYADQNYLASKPTRDAGGQFIGVFTANKMKPDNLATAIFVDAYEGKNDFTPLFFSYHVRPGRDEDWYKETKRNIPERELAKLTPELYMEQNYPCSVEEALRLPHTITVFDGRVLNDMLEDAKNPITVEKDGIDYSIVNIYQNFHLGDFYIAGSDVSLGVGRDYNVTTIMNVRTGCVVADILTNLLSPEQFALHSVRLLDVFRNPLWYPEENLWGRVVIKTAQQLGYKRFGYRDAKKTKAGWFTDDKSRIDLFGALIPAINNHQITIFNPAGIEQFRHIVRNVNKNGKIEAVSGHHDDYPIAVGICWFKKDEVQTTAWKPQPIETLHFGGKSNKWWKTANRR